MDQMTLEEMKVKRVMLVNPKGKKRIMTERELNDYFFEKSFASSERR